MIKIMVLHDAEPQSCNQPARHPAPHSPLSALSAGTRSISGQWRAPGRNASLKVRTRAGWSSWGPGASQQESDS